MRSSTRTNRYSNFRRQMSLSEVYLVEKVGLFNDLNMVALINLLLFCKTSPNRTFPQLRRITTPWAEVVNGRGGATHAW